VLYPIIFRSSDYRMLMFQVHRFLTEADERGVIVSQVGEARPSSNYVYLTLFVDKPVTDHEQPLEERLRA